MTRPFLINFCCFQDSIAFQRHLCQVRNSLMGPLTAASLELGSYQRGYDYIVK